MGGEEGRRPPDWSSQVTAQRVGIGANPAEHVSRDGRTLRVDLCRWRRSAQARKPSSLGGRIRRRVPGPPGRGSVAPKSTPTKHAKNSENFSGLDDQVQSPSVHAGPPSPKVRRRRDSVVLRYVRRWQGSAESGRRVPLVHRLRRSAVIIENGMVVRVVKSH